MCAMNGGLAAAHELRWAKQIRRAHVGIGSDAPGLRVEAGILAVNESRLTRLRQSASGSELPCWWLTRSSSNISAISSAIMSRSFGTEISGISLRGFGWSVLGSSGCFGFSVMSAVYTKATGKSGAIRTLPVRIVEGRFSCSCCMSRNRSPLGRTWWRENLDLGLGDCRSDRTSL